MTEQLARVMVQDMHAPERVASVDSNTAAQVVGGWLAADGLAGQSASVRRLTRALAAEDWAEVHSAADDLSVAITVLETHAEATAAQLAADEVFAPRGWRELLAEAHEFVADRGDGWGLLGGLGS